MTRMLVYILAICILLVGLVEEHWVFSMMSVLIASLLVILVTCNSFRVSKHSPKTFHKFVERIGLLVMILSGECILSLILIHEEQRFNTYLTLFEALAVMFTLKNIYFFSNVGMDEGHVLLEPDTPGSSMWVFF